MADFNTIDSFRYNLKSIVRPNRFLVYVYPPKSLKDEISTKDLVVYATSATIPDRAFNEIELKYYGMTYKMPAAEIIQDLIITFICDEDWDVRSLFEDWAQLVNNRENNKKGYLKELYDECYIDVNQLDLLGNLIQTYAFHYCYPKHVDQIELNQETPDTISTFQVTFGYSYWDIYE